MSRHKQVWDWGSHSDLLLQGQKVGVECGVTPFLWSDGIICYDPWEKILWFYSVF